MGITVFIHCNRKLKSFEVWFLQNNKDFYKRKVYLGTCPVCGACLAELFEIRKYDGAVFRKTFYKKEAENLIQKVLPQVEYTSRDVKKFKKTPFGLCYGENKELHNKQGKVIRIEQRRCDYFGTKEIILKRNLPNI